jgi:hypothetical protein
MAPAIEELKKLISSSFVGGGASQWQPNLLRNTTPMFWTEQPSTKFCLWIAPPYPRPNSAA